MTAIFFNTIHLNISELKDATHNVNKQEMRITEIFKSAKLPLSPSMVHHIYNHIFPPVPITSIRRALTNLSNDNVLTKTDAMSMGEHGKHQHIWKLTVSNEQQQLNLF